MRFPALGETDLLVPLHEGMFEQPMWQTFLARLRSLTGASYAGLIFRPPDRGEAIELFTGDPVPARFSRLFAEKYGQDPLQHRQMREGRVYALDELIEAAGAAGIRFREEFLKPMGLNYLRSMRLRDASGFDAWLVVASRVEFSAALGNLLVALTPHLKVAFKVFAALERERARASLSADVFARLNFGWMTLDARCRIVECDKQAERLLASTGLLRRGPYERLIPVEPAIDRELAALVTKCAADPDARPRVVNLSRDPWIDMLVAPLRERPVGAGSAAVAALYLSGDRTSRADRCEQLGELFGLTPSEARLAWSIAQGHSIAEAADEQGLTVETARNYSKKIYAKTGARGQSDLVRHILTSVLALA